ncbi:hypothetical protein HDU96_001906, partial [Phlyctochytrium bullatum]
AFCQEFNKKRAEVKLVGKHRDPRRNTADGIANWMGKSTLTTKPSTSEAQGNRMCSTTSALRKVKSAGAKIGKASAAAKSNVQAVPAAQAVGETGKEDGYDVLARLLTASTAPDPEERPRKGYYSLILNRIDAISASPAPSTFNNPEQRTPPPEDRVLHQLNFSTTIIAAPPSPAATSSPRSPTYATRNHVAGATVQDNTVMTLLDEPVDALFAEPMILSDSDAGPIESSDDSDDDDLVAIEYTRPAPAIFTRAEAPRSAPPSAGASFQFFGAAAGSTKRGGMHERRVMRNKAREEPDVERRGTRARSSAARRAGRAAAPY